MGFFHMQMGKFISDKDKTVPILYNKSMTKKSQPANPVNIENTKSSIKASKVADQIGYKTKA